MQNFVQYVNDTGPITATTVVFGYLPGQTIPGYFNLLSPTGAQSITLPPSTSVLPTVPGSNAQQVSGFGGWDMVFLNTTTQTITISANAADTGGIVGTVSINTANSHVRLHADPGQLTWYVIG